MALNCLCIVGFGFASGTCLCRILRRSHPKEMADLSGLVLVSISFPNSFSVPLTLFIAVAGHPSLQPPGMRMSVEATVDRATSLFLFSCASAGGQSNAGSFASGSL